MISEGDHGARSNVKSHKIIHGPSDEELQHLLQYLPAIHINGADRILLIWGREVFKEDWISDVTRNWLALLDADTLKYDESYEEQEQKIYAIMVELDYKVLRKYLHMDALYALAKIEDAERAKGTWKEEK